MTRKATHPGLPYKDASGSSHKIEKLSSLIDPAPMQNYARETSGNGIADTVDDSVSLRVEPSPSPAPSSASPESSCAQPCPSCAIAEENKTRSFIIIVVIVRAISIGVTLIWLKLAGKI